MSKHILVNIEFNVGYVNKVIGNFEVSCNIQYMNNDIQRIKDFITYALKESHTNFDATLTMSENSKNSIRFIMEDYKNGYQKRPLKDNLYQEVPSKTFGTEGNARKEIKKDIIKTLKEMALSAI